jgi:ABC-2 type transport system ATP-binding protein
MKMITGFLAPDAGTVVVGGNDITQAPVLVKRLIGYLPEGAPAYPDMTPVSFLDFIAEIRGITGQLKARRIADTVAKVNLSEVLYKPIDTLSKGFKRRVGLAQAILHDPDVLVLDEPTDGLDPNQKYEVRSLIKAMSKNKVIILSTHILEEVDAVCTRAVIIAGGKLIADGAPEMLESRSPLHNSVSLTLKGIDGNSVQRDLLGVPGVARVESGGGSNSEHTTFRVLAASGQSIVSAVSHLAHSKKWEIEELQVHRGRLDDVFRQVTMTHQSRT